MWDPEEHLPSEGKTSMMSYLDYSSQERKNNCPNFWALTIPYPGHSSSTKQSATWREWICPRECLSLIAEPGPFTYLAIPPTLNKVQPGENESALGNAYPWLSNLDHSPIWAIPLALNKVKPGENESDLGSDYPYHFLRKWLSSTSLQNGPFFETSHNCELQKNDCPSRWTSLLDHY